MNSPCRLFLISALLLLAQLAPGQNARQPDWQVVIKSIKMDRIRNVDPGIPAPGITPDQSSEWIRFIVTYDLSTGRTGYKPEDALWAENVQFDWSVVLPREYSGKLNPRYSVRMKRSIFYDSVSEGDNRLALLFVHPRTYDRYKKDLARDMAMLQVQIKVDGRTRAEGWARGRNFATEKSEASKMFPEFGRGGTWFESEDVPMGSGLVSRMASPWAHSGYFFRISKEEGN